MKKIGALAGIFLILLCGCNRLFSPTIEIKEMKIAIYRDAYLSNKCFLLEINPTGEVKIIGGVRKNYNIDDPNFMKVIKSETIQLSKRQIKYLSKTFNKITEFNGKQNVVADGWELIIKNNDGEFKFGLKCAKDENLNKFIDKLIECLPLVSESIN